MFPSLTTFLPMWIIIASGAFLLFLMFLGIYAFVVSMERGGASRAQKPDGKKTEYKYVARRNFLTPSETDFYNALGMAVGAQFRIFAQVHLSSILDERAINGQSWRGARAHISQKSVDFLLCDKETLAPRLAIELDDKSHQRPDRAGRDVEVERIFAEANLPLLRIENNGRFDMKYISEKVWEVLSTG